MNKIKEVKQRLVNRRLTNYTLGATALSEIKINCIFSTSFHSLDKERNYTIYNFASVRNCERVIKMGVLGEYQKIK